MKDTNKRIVRECSVLLPEMPETDLSAEDDFVAVAGLHNMPIADFTAVRRLSKMLFDDIDNCGENDATIYWSHADKLHRCNGNFVTFGGLMVTPQTMNDMYRFMGLLPDDFATLNARKFTPL